MIQVVNGALRAAEAAARAARLDSTGLRALRVGENVILLLPKASAVARVARGAARESVRRELRIAAWLVKTEVPAVRPLVLEPFVDDEWVVSFWEELPEVRPSDLVTLAGFLRRLHAVAVPDGVAVGPLRPFVRIAERIDSAPILSDDDRRFLRDMHADLVDRWARTRFDLSPALAHGDAHNENVVCTGDGRVVFLDLERIGIGQPEWDLTLTAVYHECGWHTAADYAAFADTYGYDVQTAPAWPVLKAVRLLRMTTWLAAASSGDPARAEQVRFRLGTLRDGTAPAGWDGF